MTLFHKYLEFLVASLSCPYYSHVTVTGFEVYHCLKKVKVSGSLIFSITMFLSNELLP